MPYLPEASPVARPRRAESEQLLERESELELVRELIAGPTGGGSLLLVGAAGVGKTAIVQAAVGFADREGVKTLLGSGAEFESGIEFAGLHQILLPVRNEVDRLETVHRRALDTVIGSGSGPLPDTGSVVQAVRAVLLRLASRQRVAIVVDDLQWLDEASVALLGALARDLAGSGVSYLATSVPVPAPRAAQWRGVPTRELRPLSEVAARTLLKLRHPDLDLEVQQRVLAEAGGNPLALVELPLSLDETPRTAPSSDLPLTRRLQAAFEPRLAELPDATRRLLLMTALDDRLSLTVLAERHCELTEHDMTPAEAAGLVSVDDHSRVSFRHPLLRAVVIEMSTARERRDAHLAWSSVLAGHEDELERWAWHRAQAATGADAGTARRLEEAAQVMAGRGQASAAAALLNRAAELSPLVVDRTRRIAAAAYLTSEHSGDVVHVAALLDDARKSDPDFQDSLVAAAAAASTLVLGKGEVDAAHALLVAAINGYDRRSDPDNEYLIEALHTLKMVCVLGGRAEPWEAYHLALGRLGAQPPTALVVSAQPDSARVSPEMIDLLPGAIAALNERTHPSLVVRTAAAAYHLDRVGECSTFMRKVMASDRSAGNTASAISCLILLAVDDWITGRWSLCRSRALEALNLSVAHGFDPFAASSRYQIGLIAAAGGDHETVREITQQVARWAVPRQAMLAWSYTAHIHTLAAIAEGNFEQAYRHAVSISPAGRMDPHARLAPLVILDLVESAVRTGRLAEARAHVTAIKACNLAALSPRMTVLQLACEAQVAEDEKAAALYELALSVPDNHRWPFDLARVKLAYGSHLRRRRMAAAARPWLAQARDMFGTLEATPFLARAERELLATGAKRAIAEQAPARLTAQEFQVAHLAAAGLTNKRIAERLSISARTVSTHLHRTYPKLGVKNRAGLRAALAADPSLRADHSPA